jgi:hypothetical protein
MTFALGAILGFVAGFVASIASGMWFFRGF